MPWSFFDEQNEATAQPVVQLPHPSPLSVPQSGPQPVATASVNARN